MENMAMGLIGFFLWMVLGLIGFFSTALFVVLAYVLVFEYCLRKTSTARRRILMIEVLVMGCMGVMVLKGLWVLVVLACAILVGLIPESVFHHTFERYYRRRFLWHQRLPRGRLLFEDPSKHNILQRQPSLSHDERE